MSYNYADSHSNDDRILSSLFALQEGAKKLEAVRNRSRILKIKSEIWQVDNFSFPSGKDYVEKKVEKKSGVWTEFAMPVEGTGNRAVELFVDYFSHQIVGLADVKLTAHTSKYRSVQVERSKLILHSSSEETLKSLSTLSSFVSLKKGWNGYGAEPLDRELIEFCRALVSNLPQDRQPDIFPTPRGTIQFEYEKDDGSYLEIEVSLGAFELYGEFPNGETYIESSILDWGSVLHCIEWVNAK